MLFDAGVEHNINSTGCGEWPGTVEKLQSTVLPHMGWNTVEVPVGSDMLAGVAEDERFYFVHSYGVRRWELETEITRPPQVSWTEHAGDRFVAAVENGALWATQFHPEKSGDAGAQLLENWMRTL